MASILSVEALADCGLRGDRYATDRGRKTPDSQVTLIEIENIEEFRESSGLYMEPDAPRRNIVTRGVKLNDLCGKRFSVGGATLEGIELCEPCGLFAQRTYKSVLELFVGKGGLRARIVTGGTIRVGDSVIEAKATPKV
jgi:MOSC domain-containing protein YiiM